MLKDCIFCIKLVVKSSSQPFIHHISKKFLLPHKNIFKAFLTTKKLFELYISHFLIKINYFSLRGRSRTLFECLSLSLNPTKISISDKQLMRAFEFLMKIFFSFFHCGMLTVRIWRRSALETSGVVRISFQWVILHFCWICRRESPLKSFTVTHAHLEALKFVELFSPEQEKSFRFMVFT